MNIGVYVDKHGVVRISITNEYDNIENIKIPLIDGINGYLKHISNLIDVIKKLCQKYDTKVLIYDVQGKVIDRLYKENLIYSVNYNGKDNHNYYTLTEYNEVYLINGYNKISDNYDKEYYDSIRISLIPEMIKRKILSLTLPDVISQSKYALVELYNQIKEKDYTSKIFNIGEKTSVIFANPDNYSVDNLCNCIKEMRIYGFERIYQSSLEYDNLYNHTLKDLEDEIFSDNLQSTKVDFLKKFYIPDISEFRKGFKYKKLVPDKNSQYKEIWIDEIFKGDLSINDIKYLIDCGRIKVDYLKEDDILFLGFKKSWDNFYTLGDINIDGTIGVNYNGCIINEVYYFKDRKENILPITIKNINELDLLIKQIKCNV